MTAKEGFLKFINNASDQTLAMVFYLCKRYLPEKVDDYKEVASGEFIAELVKEMNTERSEDDLKESGSAPELTHNERFLGVFDSLVSIRTSPRDGDTAVLSGAETHWVFFNGTWSCVDKTPITVRTTQTLYFDYDGDTWDVESPKAWMYPNVAGKDYAVLRKGSILVFDYDEWELGRLKFKGKTLDGKSTITFSSPTAMFGSGWFEEVKK